MTWIWLVMSLTDNNHNIEQLKSNFNKDTPICRMCGLSKWININKAEHLCFHLQQLARNNFQFQWNILIWIFFVSPATLSRWSGVSGSTIPTVIRCSGGACVDARWQLIISTLILSEMLWENMVQRCWTDVGGISFTIGWINEHLSWFDLLNVYGELV